MTDAQTIAMLRREVKKLRKDLDAKAAAVSWLRATLALQHFCAAGAAWQAFIQERRDHIKTHLKLKFHEQENRARGSERRKHGRED